MYRVSVDYKWTNSGQSCTPSPPEEAAADPMSPAPACPGTVGQVNGKTVCVPKETGDRNTTKALGGTTSMTTGNPPAGTNGSTGNIPTTGTGENSGGPKKPTDGDTITPTGTRVTSGTTTVPDGTKPIVEGKEQAACGAPGQPKCAIDESGVPRSVPGNSTNELGAADSARTAKLNEILSPAGKDTSWAMPAWFTARGGCEPWNLGTLHIGGGEIPFTVNICPLRPYIDGVLAWLWVFGTFLACLAMMGRVMGAGAK